MSELQGPFVAFRLVMRPWGRTRSKERNCPTSLFALKLVANIVETCATARHKEGGDQPIALILQRGKSRIIYEKFKSELRVAFEMKTKKTMIPTDGSNQPLSSIVYGALQPVRMWQLNETVPLTGQKLPWWSSLDCRDWIELELWRMTEGDGDNKILKQ